MKISNSAINTFTSCGQKYYYSYVKGYKSIWESSALRFGSAIDAALNHMLLNRDKENIVQDTKLIFEQEWVSQKGRGGQVVHIETNPYLEYADSDFDKDLLDEADFQKLTMIYQEWESIFDSIKRKKKAVGWENVPENDRSFYNFVNWLSLRQKGRVLIEAYHKYILPQIDEVLDVQRHVSVDNGSGSILHGYVDLVVRLKDGSVAVMDNKTSSIEYKQDSAVYSPQLTLYMMLLNNMDLPYKVEKVGYIVLRKGILKTKTKVCKSCGYQASEGSTHKTCNNTTAEGKRCGGEWGVTLQKDVDFQFITATPPETFQEDLLTNINVINTLIKSGLYAKNYNACMNSYGKPCEFLKICRKELTEDPNLVIKD